MIEPREKWLALIIWVACVVAIVVAFNFALTL